MQDCLDGSDETSDCVFEFGCCTGEFDITNFGGVPASGFEYIGWDRFWFKIEIRNSRKILTPFFIFLLERGRTPTLGKILTDRKNS